MQSKHKNARYHVKQKLVEAIRRNGFALIHTQPEESIMMGSFVFDDIEESEREVNISKKKRKNGLPQTKGQTQARSRDIRSMLTCLRKVQSTKKKTVDQKGSEENSVIILDD